MAGIVAYDSPGQRTRAARLLKLIAEALGLPALETDSEEQLAAYISGANSEIGAFLRERGVSNVTETQLLALVPRLGEVPEMPRPEAGNIPHAKVITTAISTGTLAMTEATATRLTVYGTGTVRITFSLRSGSASTTVNGRVLKNGVAIGVLRSTQSTTLVTYSEDFSMANNDIFSLGFNVATGTSSAFLQNMTLGFTAMPFVLVP